MDKNYKIQIAQKLDAKPSQIFTYWKGRVGLYAILKSLNIKEGDEVIIPAFTCVVVPNAIIYLKAKPVYVDINAQTYNTTLSQVEHAVTTNTKAILIQNTFGLSSEVEEIARFAKQKNIITIEDCTHGFGGTYNQKPNGTFADFSFFSSQWNKPFSTGIGGFIYVKNEQYIQSIKTVNEQLVQPSLKEVTMLRFLYFIKNILITPKTYWTLIKLYRFLSKKGIVVGSSSGEEITSIKEPKGYFKSSSNFQAKKGIKQLNKLDQLINHRIENAKKINVFLIKHDKVSVNKSLYPNHSFLKFPVLVTNRSEFKEAAEKANIKLGDWFVSPIHPIESDFHKWQLVVDDYPTAKNISEKILNLDTDTKNIDKTLEFLSNNLQYII